MIAFTKYTKPLHNSAVQIKSFKVGVNRYEMYADGD